MSPRIAIIGKNTLMIEGLRQMLVEVMPFAQYSALASPAEMQGDYVHYFITPAAYSENPDFFNQRLHRTIILQDAEHLSTSPAPTEMLAPLSNFRTINMLQPREAILRQLLQVQQTGHPHNANYPQAIRQAAARQENILTAREKEVLVLLAKGMINKEIADHLHISINTAITHRKHIMQKLNSQSLSKIAIYAVQHGLVSPGEIN